MLNQFFYKLSVGLSFNVCIALFIYIIYEFIFRPHNMWITISDYGKTYFQSILILIHWVAGGLGMLFVWIQLIKTKYRWLHVWNGRFFVTCINVTAIAGLIYVAFIGTIGGPPMSISFVIYGSVIPILTYRMYSAILSGDKYHHQKYAKSLLWFSFSSPFYHVLISPLFFLSNISNVAKILYLNSMAYLMYIPWLIYVLYQFAK